MPHPGPEAVTELPVLRAGEHGGRREVEHGVEAGGQLAEAGQLGLGEVVGVLHGGEIENEVGGGRGGLTNNIGALDHTSVLQSDILAALQLAQHGTRLDPELNTLVNVQLPGAGTEAAEVGLDTGVVVMILPLALACDNQQCDAISRN